MIRHYVARRAKVIFDHPHNAELRMLRVRRSGRWSIIDAACSTLRSDRLGSDLPVEESGAAAEVIGDYPRGQAQDRFGWHRVFLVGVRSLRAADGRTDEAGVEDDGSHAPAVAGWRRCRGRGR